MIIFIFFLFAAIILFIFSKNKKVYQKTVTENGIEYANRLFKIMKISAYLLSFFAGLELVLIILKR